MAQAREEELIDYPVIRYVSDKDSFVDDHKYTSMECYLDIDLNGKRFTTSFCSPGDHIDLVIGILAQMGQIRTYDDIVRLDIDEENLQATVVTTADAQAWASHNATDPRYFRAREILDCEPECRQAARRARRDAREDEWRAQRHHLGPAGGEDPRLPRGHRPPQCLRQALRLVAAQPCRHHGQDHHLQWALLVGDDDEARPHGHLHRGREVRADDALAGACQEARHHARRAHGTGHFCVYTNPERIVC